MEGAVPRISALNKGLIYLASGVKIATAAFKTQLKVQ